MNNTLMLQTLYLVSELIKVSCHDQVSDHAQQAVAVPSQPASRLDIAQALLRCHQSHS